MSDDATGELIVEVPKYSREVIRLQRTTFNGVPLVDARVWTVPIVPGGESKPTRKGLTLRPETWVELAAALKIALRYRPPAPEAVLIGNVGVPAGATETGARIRGAPCSGPGRRGPRHQRRPARAENGPLRERPTTPPAGLRTRFRLVPS